MAPNGCILYRHNLPGTIRPPAVPSRCQTAEPAEEIDGQIHQIQAATETGSAATQVLSASSGLAKQAEELSGEVHSFVADVKAA